MIIRVLFAGISGATALVVAACTNGVESPTGPGPIPQPDSTIVYTALGASDTAGVGSSAPCVPATDCPQGCGYVQVATRDLRSRGFTVTLYNLGFPAMVLSRRIEDLGKQYGRDFIPGNIIERQAPVVFTTTTLVTIFTGPNDVDSIVAALGGGAGGADQVSYINTQLQLFAQEFESLIARVREKAPTARIVALNVPNMAGMPRSAGASVQQRRAQQLLSVGMTTQAINPQASRGVLVLDLMCDARSYQASTYSSDGFHPSDTGYAWMAAEVIAAATSTYRAPASSCPQMTLVN
jgi:lysophospholipase L1-like esterase